MILVITLFPIVPLVIAYLHSRLRCSVALSFNEKSLKILVPTKKPPRRKPIPTGFISPTSDKTRVLLVISHPDDESMFFVPTINSLIRCEDVEVFVLCLSTGNFDGMGMQRQLEMDDAVEFLGIEIDNVTIVDSPELQVRLKSRISICFRSPPLLRWFY